MQTTLLFKAQLNLESGKASVPALLWKATPDKLVIFALNGKKRPDSHTLLYHAPFFNVHEDASVCMGDVRIDFAPDATLQGFMAGWQDHFFNSYFSHMIASQSPVKINIIDLWKKLINTGKPFPLNVLKPTNLTINDILL